jgi:hypothetical protein
VLFYVCFAAYAEETVQQREKASQGGGFGRSDNRERVQRIGRSYLETWDDYLPHIDLRQRSQFVFVRIVTEIWLNSRSPAGPVQLKVIKKLIGHFSWQCAELHEAERAGDSRNYILQWFHEDLQELLYRFLMTKFGQLKTVGGTGEGSNETKRYLVDIWLAWLKPIPGSTWRIYEQPTADRGWMQQARRPKDLVQRIKSADEKKKYDEIVKVRGQSFQSLVINVDILGALLSLLQQSSFTDSRVWSEATTLLDDALWSFFSLGDNENYPREKRLAVMLPVIGDCQWLPRCFQGNDGRGTEPPSFNRHATERIEYVLERVNDMGFTIKDAENELNPYRAAPLGGRLPHPDIPTVLADVYRRRRAGAAAGPTNQQIVQGAKKQHGADVTTWTYLNFSLPLAQELSSNASLAAYRLKLSPKFKHMALAIFLQLHQGIFEHHAVLRLYALIAEKWGFGEHRARDLLRGVNWMKIYFDRYHRRREIVARNPLADSLVQAFLGGFVGALLLYLILAANAPMWLSGLVGWLLRWAFFLTLVAPLFIWVTEFVLEQIEETVFYKYIRIEAALKSLLSLDVKRTDHEDWNNVDWKSFLPSVLRLDSLLPSLTENVALCLLWTAQYIVSFFFGYDLVPIPILAFCVVALHILAPDLPVVRSRKLRTGEISPLVLLFSALDGFFNDTATASLPVKVPVGFHTRSLASIDRLFFVVSWLVLDWCLGESWRRFLLTLSGFIAFALIGKSMPACTDGRSRTTNKATSLVLNLLIIVIVLNLLQLCFLKLWAPPSEESGSASKPQEPRPQRASKKKRGRHARGN